MVCSSGLFSSVWFVAGAGVHDLRGPEYRAAWRVFLEGSPQAVNSVPSGLLQDSASKIYERTKY